MTSLAKQFFQNEELLKALIKEIRRHTDGLVVYIELPDDPRLLNEMKADKANFEYVEEANMMRVKFPTATADYSNELELRDAVWVLLHILDYYGLRRLFVGEKRVVIDLRELHYRYLQGKIEVNNVHDHNEGNREEVVKEVSDKEEIEIEVEAFIESLRKLVQIAKDKGEAL